MAEPTLPEKVAFLRTLPPNGGAPGDTVVIETHMSWVFLTGDRVFKLKKPVRFSYLDFSTLSRREAVCRAELSLNRRLAPAVYLDVRPLCFGASGFSVGQGGMIVDWLVVMRRLNHRYMLDRAIGSGDVDARRIDGVTRSLAAFYRHAARVTLSPETHLREWERSVEENFRNLCRHGFELPRGPIWRIHRIQRRFLKERRGLFAERVRAKRIVDGHGDLRPEHVWLGDPLQIIDRLEFNPRLRAVDPFDEIAFLGLECERFGAPWIGPRMARGLMCALPDRCPHELLSFYRCYRATLRARLTIAHLLEPDGRTPEKWPRLARAYLRIADAEAARLECALRRRAGRPVRALHAAAGRSPRATRRKKD